MSPNLSASGTTRINMITMAYIIKMTVLFWCSINEVKANLAHSLKSYNKLNLQVIVLGYDHQVAEDQSQLPIQY